MPYFTGLTAARASPARSQFFTDVDLANQGADALNNYLAAKGFNDRNTQLFAAGLIRFIMNLNGDQTTNQLYASLVTTNFAINFAAATTAMEGGTADQKSFAADAKIAQGNSGGYLADLVNAAKKKELTIENVEGYFAMLNANHLRAAPVVRFVNGIAPYFPDHISDAAFRGVLHGSKWTDYRVTRIHAGKIIHAMIPDLAALGLVTQNDQAIIDAARNAPWDINANDAIPRRYLLLANFYHVAAGTRIDNWYQAIKVVDATPRSTCAAVRIMWERYFELKAHTAPITAAANMAALAAAVAGQF